MANTEKLGDLNDSTEKEKTKKTIATDKLGSSHDGKGKLVAWYAKNKKVIDIIGISLLVVAFFLLIYFLWLKPKWNKEASEAAQPTIATVVNNSMLSTDTATLKAALEGDEKGEIEGFLSIIDRYDHPIFKTSRAAKFSLKYYAALCYLNLGQEEEALDMLLKMKKRDSYLWYEAQMLIGDLYDDQDDTDNAKKYFQKAAKGETDFVAPIALWKLGMLCEREGDWAGAFENYEKIQNDYPERYNQMGVAKYYERAKIKAGK
jgi:tetratricopeptide (TPR) repeat protein